MPPVLISKSFITDAGATAPTASAKILIIDDDFGPRESLRILLKYDYEVLVASSVQDGLRILAEGPVEAIILDNRMPVRSGMNGLLDIRHIDPHVSVIMLTGYATLETACEAFRNEATDFMSKPHDTDAMLAAVDKNVKRTLATRTAARQARSMREAAVEMGSEIGRTRPIARLGQQADRMIQGMESPLESLRGCVDLLKVSVEGSGAGSSANVTDSMAYIGMISESVDRCRELADTWRELRSGTNFTRTAISARDFLITAVAGIQPTATWASVDVSLDLAPECTDLIRIDRAQMARVAQNLILNAIQATAEKHGSVVVEGRTVDRQFEFSVRDDGYGILPDHLASIFEPYFTTKGDGTGLGLAIARRVVEEHGGTLGVESTVGVGSRFTVRLPLAETET